MKKSKGKGLTLFAISGGAGSPRTRSVRRSLGELHQPGRGFWGWRGGRKRKGGLTSRRGAIS